MSKPIASKDFEVVNVKPLAGKVALVTGGRAASARPSRKSSPIRAQTLR